VLTGVSELSACLTEEIFAPVAPIVVFDEEQEVITRANNTPYGLAAYLFTTNLGRAWRVAEALEAGTVGVNDAVPTTSQCPFGGMKESGLGRELGSEGLEAFLETKHISFGGIGL
jgi:succinate-semialdehyde dehydrogenase/glutarate-semialdehyde dehydrogenase